MRQAYDCWQDQPGSHVTLTNSQRSLRLLVCTRSTGAHELQVHRHWSGRGCRLENDCGLHHHITRHWHKREDIDIRATHYQKVNRALHSPQSALDSKRDSRHTKPQAPIHHPPTSMTTRLHLRTLPQICNSTLLPTCHLTTPNKTHACSGWARATPDAKEWPHTFTRILKHHSYTEAVRHTQAT